MLIFFEQRCYYRYHYTLLPHQTLPKSGWIPVRLCSAWLLVYTPSFYLQIKADRFSLIESSLSVILSSLPCTAKFWRIYIEPSQLYQTLRSRLFPHKPSEDDIPSRGELPTFIKKTQKPVKKKRDPYSIGLPTTTPSEACLSDGNGLKLTEPKHELHQVQVNSDVSD